MSRVQAIPLGTGASVLTQRQPTLIANTDEPKIQSQQGPWGIGNLALIDPVNATARVGSTVTATVGGTITANDTITLTLSGPFPTTVVVYTVLVSDSVESVASAVAALVAAALPGIIGAETLGTVITFTYLPGGQVGNTVSIVRVLSGGATETFALSSASFSGGTGPMLAVRTFEAYIGVTGSKILKYFLEGHFYDMDAGTVAAFVTAKLPVA